MSVLLHICCGPCSITVVESLRAAGERAVGYFFNPNIHPYTEYRRRLDTLGAFALGVGLDLRVSPDYRPEEYFAVVTGNEDRRCELCYRLRLGNAARQARDLGCEAFTTTLLYSRFQNHDRIRAVAEAVARESGVPFRYADYREGWSRGVRESKRLGMYRQQYCGCLYSERERYLTGPVRT
jgi:predicted adenine nucleotide alpha hydrolase (AANH) superfamily ATPase